MGSGPGGVWPGLGSRPWGEGRASQWAEVSRQLGWPRSRGNGVGVGVPRQLRSRGRRARGGARVTGLESSSSRAGDPGPGRGLAATWLGGSARYPGTGLTVREGLAVARPARGGALVVRSGLGSGPRGRSCSRRLGCC